MHQAASLLVVGLWALAAVVVTAHRDERRGDRLRVGALALGARLALAVVISAALAISGRADLFPDESIFLSEARRVQSGGGLTSHGYSNTLGLLFRLTGPSAWMPRALNVVTGALLAVVAYELLSLLTSRRAALIGAGAVALWPSLVLWSAVVLKDPLVLLALFGALLGQARALRGRWDGAFGAVGAMVALQALRPYAFVVASVAMALGALARVGAGGLQRFARRRLALAGAAVLAVGLLGLAGGQGFLGIGFVRSNADTEVVSRARAEGVGATGFTFTETPPRSTAEVVKGIPHGLLYTVLGPFPRDAGQVEARVLLVVELPLWYAALAAAAAGLVRLGWRRWRFRWATLVAFGAGIMAVLAVYEGNAGTAIRQRAMAIPVALGLAATAAARLQPLHLRRLAPTGGVDRVEDRHT